MIFFDGPLLVLGLGQEVKNDMSDQSNDCLRVYNVKIKKNTWAKMGHISENLQVMACSVKRFELIFPKMFKLNGKESLDPKMSDFE